jgi:hypothetical protein
MILISIPPLTDIGAIAAIVVSILCGGYQGFKTWRKKIAAGEKAKEDEIQRRIDAAVEAERDRCRQQKIDETERIARLKELADEWQKIATQNKETNNHLSDQLSVAQKKIAVLEIQYTEVTQMNIDLQKRIGELEKLVKAE